MKRAALLLAVLPGLPASADEVLTLQRAVTAATAAMELCQAQQAHAGVVVADASGKPKAVLIADGANALAFESARRKAFTAAATGIPSEKLGALERDKPQVGRDVLALHPDLTGLGGGLPIIKEGMVIGAIGVGGAKGPDIDLSCARAGLDAIGAVP